MDLTSMFDHICSSNVVIASQQRDEPDFTREQKQEILDQLYKTNPANFIYRFSSLLTDNELRTHYDPNADYMQEILHSNRNKIRSNRRYAYMQQLIANGSYFSDEAMKERSPLLYEQMVGKYTKDPPLVTRTANGPLSDFYMEHLESITHQERLEREFEKEEQLRLHDNNDNDNNDNDEDDDEDEDEDEDDDDEKNYSTAERDLYRQEFLAIQKERFLNGEDSNIDYASIDNNETLDNVKIRERDEEEKYFDDEDSYIYSNEEP